MDQDAFHQLWGTSGIAPPPSAAVDDGSGTRSLDPKAFADTWLNASAAKGGPVKEDTTTANSAANAALGGIVEGIPIVGPSIKSGTEKAAAKIRSVMYGTPYEDELAAVRNYNAQSAVAHPGLNTTGEVVGAVAPMLTGVGLAPRAFGMVGPMVQRVGFGAGTNALIAGADTYARTGDAGDAAKSALIGGAIGGGLPVVGDVAGAVGRRLIGAPTDPATNALIQRAEALGIPLRPSQVSTSPFINKLDQMIAKIPGSGMGRLVDEQHAGVNRAVARTFGEDADRITPDVMAAARRRIGADFDAVERGTTVRFDNTLGHRLGDILHEASTVLEPDQITPLANRITNIADLARAGQFDGETFSNMMKKGAPLSRLQSSADPNVKHYAGQIREALQDALERSATPEMAQRYNTARYQYRNMKTIQPLAEKAATGNISPTLLLNEVRKANPNFAYGSGGDIADIARIGQRFMRQPADSGTPLGNVVMSTLLKGGAGLAAAGGIGAAYKYSDNPLRDTGLGLASILAAGLGARGANTLLNRPATVQNALRAGGALVPAYNQQTENRP